MLCPIDLTAALLLALIYPFLCERHKAQVRTGLHAVVQRGKVVLNSTSRFMRTIERDFRNLGRKTTMPAKAKLTTWNINGIEFEARALYNTGLLPEGLVRDPNDGDLFFFDHGSLAETELGQLIDEGYLLVFDRLMRLATPGTFCVRLALDSRQNFYLVDGRPEIATCVLCDRDFPFIDNGDNMIQTAPATGRSYASGGSPPDYDSACTECMEAGPDEEEYDFEDEDDFYEDDDGCC